MWVFGLLHLKRRGWNRPSPGLGRKGYQVGEKKLERETTNKNTWSFIASCVFILFLKNFFLNKNLGEKNISRVKVMMWMNNCNKQKTIWGLGILPTSGFFSGELSPCALDITHGVRVAGHHQEVVESCANVLFTPIFFWTAAKKRIGI